MNTMKSQAWNKFWGLAVVLGLLLWGLGQISDLVAQRQEQRQVAIQSVAQSLAGTQTLLGPLIYTACTEEWSDDASKNDNKNDKKAEPQGDGKGSKGGKREFKLMAAPANLAVKGSSALEPRARGLHTTQVFHLQTTLSAQWTDLNSLKAERTHPGSRLQCGPTLLMLSVSDARGIRQIDVKLNGTAQTVRSGTSLYAYPRGIHTVLPGNLDTNQPLSAEVQLELMGTEHLALVPLGTATHISLHSNWPHPSFGGQFLPVEHRISDSGFDASWRVSALASTAQQSVLLLRNPCASFWGAAPGVEEPVHAQNAQKNQGCVETLGVTFVDPGNTYALSNRATKYGVLFIALTFVAVGLFELMRALRVHPIQYLLVGAAISVFFLLLVSLSEQLAFGSAYAIAATACVLLLAYYASHILQSWKHGLPFGAGIAILYGLLYVLLQLEQKALVVGSIALFLVLALVMTLTRKVDWYAQLQTPGGATPAPTPTPAPAPTVPSGAEVG